ncbi:hypothetical protein MSAN_01142600 [Mycena sanguinolenta]|uniref:Uncharacterized protein n=1 Tax=Mycena sanguinolenta TaxID=230812 RepID=A0A8H6YH84_9AGAR|nr:hypothetical protein MSAN_01142600 [Mycena sanguinolenta]
MRRLSVCIDLGQLLEDRPIEPRELIDPASAARARTVRDELDVDVELEPAPAVEEQIARLASHTRSQRHRFADDAHPAGRASPPSTPPPTQARAHHAQPRLPSAPLAYTTRLRLRLFFSRLPSRSHTPAQTPNYASAPDGTTSTSRHSRNRDELPVLPARRPLPRVHDSPAAWCELAVYVHFPPQARGRQARRPSQVEVVAISPPCPAVAEAQVQREEGRWREGPMDGALVLPEMWVDERDRQRARRVRRRRRTLSSRRLARAPLPERTQPTPMRLRACSRWIKKTEVEAFCTQYNPVIVAKPCASKAEGLRAAILALAYQDPRPRGVFEVALLKTAAASRCSGTRRAACVIHGHRQVDWSLYRDFTAPNANATLTAYGTNARTATVPDAHGYWANAANVARPPNVITIPAPAARFSTNTVAPAPVRPSSSRDPALVPPNAAPSTTRRQTRKTTARHRRARKTPTSSSSSSSTPPSSSPPSPPCASPQRSSSSPRGAQHARPARGRDRDERAGRGHEGEKEGKEMKREGEGETTVVDPASASTVG